MDDDVIIKRTVHTKPLWKILEHYQLRRRDWETKKTVCVVRGMPGCGKTAYLLDYFKNKPLFYFSFAGYGEELAEKLFSEYAAEKTGDAVVGWEDCFRAISKKYKYIIFDDLSAVSSYKRFKKAFYDRMITNILTRPFIVLIVQPDEDISGMADNYDPLHMGYFLIPEVMKLFPSLAKHDILGLCTVSGGIPKILSEYDINQPFEENLRSMLTPSSAFCALMPELLGKYLRKPDVYHQIMSAIATGQHSISNIGKYTGFAYNKCDNYLSRLIKYGFVRADKVPTGNGLEKTAYHLTSSYFKLWYRYIFRSFTGICLENQELIDSIVRNIIDTEIHEFHLQKAFALANKRVYWDFWEGFGIDKQILYKPQTVRSVTNRAAGRFSYEFDAIVRSGNKAVFVKVFRNPLENCKKDELNRIRRAMELVNMYYDSHVFIFSKRRFSDYAVHEAARDECLSLVEVERLKY